MNIGLYCTTITSSFLHCNSPAQLCMLLLHTLVFHGSLSINSLPLMNQLRCPLPVQRRKHIGKLHVASLCSKCSKLSWAWAFARVSRPLEDIRATWGGPIWALHITMLSSICVGEAGRAKLSRMLYSSELRVKGYYHYYYYYYCYYLLSL